MLGGSLAPLSGFYLRHPLQGSRQQPPVLPVSASANRHDQLLLLPMIEVVFETLGGLPEQTRVHLDRGYDSVPIRQRLAQMGLGW